MKGLTGLTCTGSRLISYYNPSGGKEEFTIATIVSDPLVVNDRVLVVILLPDGTIHMANIYDIITIISNYDEENGNDNK